MKKFVFGFVVIFSMFAQSAMADFLGLANGRSANLDNMADMSIEGGANIWGDGNLLGTRLNYKVSPDLMAFGDLGRFAVDGSGADSDGLVYGIGAFYQLRNVNLLENTDLAVRGAYHLGTLDAGGGVDLDWSEITIQALISGDQLGETDLGWYANVGMHILEQDIGVSFIDPFTGQRISGGGSDSNNELGFGGGVTKPMSFGEVYGGVNFIDGGILVAGVRYNL